MDFGNCGGEGHGVTTCTNKRGALAQDDSLKTATYDGRKLRLNGEVLGLVDERRKLVAHIVVLPGVTAIHDFAIYGCTSISCHGRWTTRATTCATLILEAAVH